MIAPITLGTIAPGVVRKPDVFALDTLRGEAAEVLADVFGDVPGKRIEQQSLPGYGRHGISRAINGCSSNPLFRIIGFFVLMKRLGMTGDRAQRIIDFLQEVKDSIWPPEEPLDPRKVLEEEQRLDSQDDEPQQRLAWGDRSAAVEMLAAVRRQQAHLPSVISVLRQLAATETVG